MNRADIREHFSENKEFIGKRVGSFRSLKEGASEKRLFQELVFVTLTSQSQARNCWECALKLESRDLLKDGDVEEIAEVIEDFNIQYSRNKGSYIVDNRKELSQPTFSDPEPQLNLRNKIKEDNVTRTREWMAEKLKGISWKGSSHYLRNTGYGLELAVLSKPLMSKLTELGVLNKVKPPSGKKDYLKVEEKFQDLAKELSMQPVELDLTLWSMETGEVFK